jgi:YVTN family beta-propeller protein
MEAEDQTERAACPGKDRMTRPPRLIFRAIVACALAIAFAVAIVSGGAARIAPTLLPNGWHLAPPLAGVVNVGTLPSGMALSRDGTRAFILETGHQQPALRIIDARTLATLRTVTLNNAYGAPLRDPDGDGVWVGDTSSFQEQIAHIDTESGRVDRTVSLPIPFAASALAFSPDGRTLAVAGDLANRVAFIERASGTIVATVATGRHPAALAYAPDGRRLFVADRAQSQLDVIDTATNTVGASIAVGLHPAALAVNGDRLYVADTDDDNITVISLATQKLLAHAALPFVANGAVGSSPDALFFDGDRLYVPCGAANAVAVFRTTPTGLTPLGAVPTGWYPTSVARAADGALIVLDGKGESSHANPRYSPSGRQDYIADNLIGSVRRIPVPDDAALRQDLASVESLGAPYALRSPAPSPIVRAHGPIAHVIYVVKENRTYDQVLGDISAADGDAALTMFGASITPNEHALARRFGVFDRFFTDAHVSADGHSWSLGAFANDYLERTWPANYAQRRPFYDFEDGAEAAVPHSGYLWNAAAHAHITYRNYGEFVTAGPTDDGVPTSSTDPALESHTDVDFPTFDLNLRDVARFAEWKREFDVYEQRRTLPQLEIVRFPRDHTAGTQTGKNTPLAMVADNDQAVGMLAAAVSHSRDWNSTAIFVLEDDSQSGPDHVDEQRSTLYLISPYAKGGVLHEHYSTSSVLRTIETILGLAPLSRYDAGAAPLGDAFRTKPDLTPFDVVPPKTDLDAKNKATAYRAGDSDRLDFAHADDVDEGTLNDILWGSIRGAASARPLVGAFTSAAR